jgi:hypothetical protein
LKSNFVRLKNAEEAKSITTFVENIFGGKLSSTIVCTGCGSVSRVYEQFLDLSLQVPGRFIEESMPKRTTSISSRRVIMKKNFL